MKPRILLLVVLVLLLAGVAAADTLYLKNGRKFEGRVVRETEQVVIFEIRGVGSQPFNRKDIEKIEKGASVFDEYDRRKATAASDDADAQFALGQWCFENGLRKEARRAFRAAIKADPDHKDSRLALGYSRVDGRWMTRKEFKQHREKRKKELEKILGALALGDLVKDRECNVCFCPPKGWKKTDALGGLGISWVGPTLHGVSLRIGYEVAEPADLAIFKNSVVREIKADHGDVEIVAKDALTDLGGKVAKEYVVRYGGTGERAERHDIFFERKVDLVHVWYVCPLEDVTALAELFAKVRGSFKLTAEDSMGAGDLEYELPGDDWERGLGALGQVDGFASPDIGADVEIVGHESHPTFILIGWTEAEGDAKKNLAEFREQLWKDSTEGFRFFPAHDKEWKRKVAGEDTVVTPFTGSRGGQAALDGFMTVFVKGDRLYVVLAMNLFGSMGEKYLKADLNKLLDSLKIG